MGHALVGPSVSRGPDDGLDMQQRARFRINFHAILLSNRDMLAGVHISQSNDRPCTGKMSRWVEAMIS